MDSMDRDRDRDRMREYGTDEMSRDWGLRCGWMMDVDVTLVGKMDAWWDGWGWRICICCNRDSRG